MKWVKWGLVILLVIAVVIVFSSKVFQKKYTYYYYPHWNAYYDVQHKNYIYSVDGGKSWDTITNSSNAVANTLGKKIVLRSTSSEIWMENAEHRQRYGGTLNDLVGGFLKTGEDKRPVKKKNPVKDSSKADLQATRNANDSTNEIEEWIHETTIQDNTAKEKKDDDEGQSSIEKIENISIPVNDSTEP